MTRRKRGFISVWGLEKYQISLANKQIISNTEHNAILITCKTFGDVYHENNISCEKQIYVKKRLLLLDKFTQFLKL